MPDPDRQIEPVSARRRHRSAMAISTAIHVVIFVLGGLLIRPMIKGGADEEGRTGGIVLARPTSSATEYFSPADSEASSTEANAEAASAAAAAAEAAARPAMPDLNGLLPAIPEGGGGASSGIGNLPDASSLTEGSGLGGIGGPTSTTQVFGVQGTGSRFVYVFDRSASMEDFGGRPLEVAKRELISSLGSLRKTCEFQVVFYNERPTVFNPTPGAPATLLFASDVNRQSAVDFVQSIKGRGGTGHLAALEAALRMAPDVVFFLTDADEPRLSDEELALIERWNRSAASIHTIEFGVGPKRSGVNFLERIAQQNGGQYVYRDVATLETR